MTILQNYTFPVACVVILGWYLATTQKTNREDNLRREEIYRTDTKEREEKLHVILAESQSTNGRLLESNKVLVDTNKLLVERVERIEKDVSSIKHNMDEVRDDIKEMKVRG